MKIFAGGHEGNAHMIMARVHECLTGAGRKNEVRAILQRMRGAASYRELCDIAKEVTFGSIEVVGNREEADV